MTAESSTRRRRAEAAPHDDQMWPGSVWRHTIWMRAPSPLDDGRQVVIHLSRGEATLRWLGAAVGDYDDQHFPGKSYLDDATGLVPHPTVRRGHDSGTDPVQGCSRNGRWPWRRRLGLEEFHRFAGDPSSPVHGLALVGISMPTNLARTAPSHAAIACRTSGRAVLDGELTAGRHRSGCGQGAIRCQNGNSP